MAPAVRAAVAGVVLAAGIGLGAYNPWWMAVFVAVPLIITGLLIAPRPTRLSGLTPFQPGALEHYAPAQIEALTRSSLSNDDMQPTLVTATLSPANDTSYRARWMTSMSRKDFQALIDRPRTALAPETLPPREAGRTPDF